MVDCDRIADNAIEQEHSYADETETRWKAG
jgi:hypothetical protein